MARLTTSVSILSLLVLLGCEKTENNYAPPPLRELDVARPVATSITPFVDEVGVIESVSDAAVQSRVRGFLQEINFEPGEAVKAGAVLYKIEPDQYQAAEEAAKASVSNAVAAIAVAEAQVEIAQADVLKASQDMDREERLKEQNASSQAKYDEATALLAAAKASLESSKANVQSATSKKEQAEAALAQAELDLSYTQVIAEIEGKISKTDFKVGNLVENGSHLAMIVDRDQVYANFTISDTAALRLQRARQGSSEPSSPETQAWRGMTVYLSREGDQGYPFVGKLDYVDPNGIDPSTGTLGLRAIFDNGDGQLMPGLFVSLRVPAADAANSLVIPERAVQRDQQGTYVLTMDTSNKVVRSAVELGQTVGGWAIISSGLTEQDLVVIDGIQFARPGAEALPKETAFEVDSVMLLRGMSNPDQSKKLQVESNAEADASNNRSDDAAASADAQDAS